METAGTKCWTKAPPASELGRRAVRLRTGIVLSTKGGALAKMLLPFKLGLGGPVGSGSQWMSWIHIDDVVGGYHFALHPSDLSGAAHPTAPPPVAPPPPPCPPPSR